MNEKPLQPQDKYVLRLPDGMRDRLKAAAERNNRSMNAEIVKRLDESLEFESSLSPRDAEEREWGDTPKDIYKRMERERRFDQELLESILNNQRMINLALSKTLSKDDPESAEMIKNMIAESLKPKGI